MGNLQFFYDIYIATTVDKLWEALTTSEYTEKYFFGSKIQSDWQEGSSIIFSRDGIDTDYGKILIYEPHPLLSYTWNMVGDKTPRKTPSRVTFKLHPMDGTTVKLLLRHEDILETDLSDEENTFQGLNNGWPAILSNLKSLLETGRTLPSINE